VILNTGANPRMGTHRFGVTLSRQLAARGVGTLRMDIAGLGDSPAPEGRRENEIYADYSASDARAAMDVLERSAYSEFVLMGVCSGGYVSFHAALSDTRACGVVMMNPLTFDWEPGREVERNSDRAEGFRSMHYYRQRALRGDTWKRLVRGEIDVRGIALVVARQVAERAVVAARLRKTTELTRKFATLAHRGTKVLLVFNGDEPMIDGVNQQFGALTPWLREHGLSIEVIDGADHVFVPIWSQDRVAKLVCDFVVA
jgi:hypothetical protein